MFKVGDTVWCLVWGKGTVIDVYGGSVFPVCVEFDNKHTDTYTSNGKLHADDTSNRCLFFSEPVVSAEVNRPFKPRLVKGGKYIAFRKNSGAHHMICVQDEDQDGVFAAGGKYLHTKWEFFELGEKITIE